MIENVGTQALCWSSFPGASNVGYGFSAEQGSNISAWTAIDMFRGVSMRCVVDIDYIRKAENGGLFGTSVISLKEKLLP